MRRWVQGLAPVVVPLLPLLPLLALLSLFIVTELRGVDFGDQWDEKQWHIDVARDMVASGVLLPRTYIYPSFTKWMVLAPSIPAGLAPRPNPRAMQAAMKAAITSPAYLLTVRRLFIVVCSLTIVWVYGAALALRRRWWEALLAAAGIGLSWEVAYHARWVANDCVLTQFSALTLFMLALFRRSGRQGWLYAAAIAAGLGTGTKYPGVVLLVPVLAFSFANAPLRPLRGPMLRALALRAVALCAVAFAVYLATTPGMLLDPFVFIEQAKKISGAYQQGHFGYSVAGFWQHLRLVLTYLAVSYFSPYMALSLVLFAATILGAVAWARRERAVGLPMLIFPVVFVLFFCGKYRVMIARNYLFITPFLVLFTARGVTEALQRVRLRWLRWAMAGALTVALGAQAIWLVAAAEGIRHFDLPAYARQAVAYASKHSGARFRFSERVRALAADQHLALPPNVSDGPDPDMVVFLARADGPGPWRMKTNDPWLTKAVFGPSEVNFNWYSTWDSRDRVVVMTTERARASEIRLALTK